MKPSRALLLLLGIIAMLAIGIGSVLHRRVESGAVFPKYSSFRADAFGLRAIHDALSGLPGMRVERWTRPLEKIQGDGQTTWVLAGMPLAAWNGLEDNLANTIEASLQAGDRWVVLFQAELTPIAKPHVEILATPTPTPSPTPSASPTPTRAIRGERDKAIAKVVDWKKRWGIRTTVHPEVVENDAATLNAAEDQDLPRSLRWKSDIVIETFPGAETRTLYSRLGKAAMLELKRGRGTILLGGDAFYLSNERLPEEPQPRLISRILGSNTRIVFVETHLGVTDDPGMAALARRYGLGTGLFLALATAALVIWRMATAFVPPQPDAATVPLAYAPTAGLAALLRRSISPSEIGRHCREAWKKTASPHELTRLQEAESKTPANQHPVSEYNRLRDALRIKR